MDFWAVESLEGSGADTIVVAVPQFLKTPIPANLDLRRFANPLFASGDLPLKPLEMLMIPGTPRMVFIGIARSQDLETWRRAAATVVRRVKKVRNLVFANGDVRAIVEGALTGSLSVEAYKTN